MHTTHSLPYGGVSLDRAPPRTETEIETNTCETLPSQTSFADGKNMAALTRSDFTEAEILFLNCVPFSFSIGVPQRPLRSAETSKNTAHCIRTLVQDLPNQLG